MNHLPDSRVLAIDVRRNRFGYALLEGPKRLLDWGASAVPPALSHRAALKAAQKRVSALFRRCHPTVAVVKRPRRTKTGRSSTPGPILGTVLREAASLRIPVHFVSRNEMLATFRVARAHSKDDIAEILANDFSELASRLPPRRGKWGTERPRMVIFDALAAGITYWEQSPSPE